MKKLLKILAILIFVVILAIVLIPIIFKDKIFRMVKDEINKQVNAKVEITDFDLSLLRKFPDVSFSLDGITVSGINEFQNDTLLKLEKFNLSFNLWGVFDVENLKIKTIELVKPSINAIVLSDGKANFDIAPVSEDTMQVSESQDTIKFKLSLEKFEISDAQIIYDDRQSKMLAGLKGMNFLTKGDFTASTTSLQNNLSIETLTFIYDNIKYLNKVKISWDAIIDADFDKFRFVFKDNKLSINEVKLAFEGMFEMPTSDIGMDLSFSAPKTEFKDLLSLIPAVYMADFQGVKASGKLSLDGKIKGVMTEKSLPAISAGLNISGASFSYPDMPKSLEQFYLDLNYSMPGGTGDINDLSINNLHLEMGNNPFDAKLKLHSTPNDVTFDGNFKGKIDLGSISEIVPLDSMEISGLLKSDLQFDGKLNAPEYSNYQDVKVSGSFLLDNFKYQSRDLSQTVNITTAELNFNPSFIDLPALKGTMGKSDFLVKGKITDYLAYIFSESLLTGQFSLNSELFDLNQLITDEPAPAATQADTVPLEAFEIPKNINFTFQSQLKKVLFDNYEISNIEGLIELKDGKAQLTNLKLNIFDGTLIANGYYDSKDVQNPEIDFNLQLEKFNIGKTAISVNTLKKIAPIAEKCQGIFNMKFGLKTKLDKTLSPVLSTLNGNGVFNSENIIIKDSKLFNSLGDKLKNNTLKQPAVKDLIIDFVLRNGDIICNPFTTSLGQSKSTIQGRQNLDGTLDFNIDMLIPSKAINADVKKLASDLISKTGLKYDENADVNFAIGIGGTTKDPKIARFDINSKSGTSIQEDLKKKAQDEINKQKEKAQQLINEEAEKAKQEADRLKQEAEKKAQEEAAKVKEKANTEVEKAKEEAEKKKKEAEQKAKEKLKKLW